MRRDDILHKLCKLAESDYLRPDEVRVLCDATCGGMFGSGLDRSNKLGKWSGVVQCMIGGLSPYVMFCSDEYFLSRVDKWFEGHINEHRG